MKTPILTILLLVLAVCAFGQTATPAISPLGWGDPALSEQTATQQPVAAPTPDVSVTLPTYVGLGAAYNQIGTPQWNMWAGAIYPLSSPKGVYLSTVADIIPVLQTDPTTKRQFYAFSATIRQGMHKVVGTWGKFSALLGGDAGAGFSQASPSGINVMFAGSFTATAVYQISDKFAVVMPLRALYLGETKTFNVVPEVGILFKP